jgi:hypothetical protein
MGGVFSVSPAIIQLVDTNNENKESEEEEEGNYKENQEEIEDLMIWI